MKSADGRIIYIGKAVDLKNRVSSYFKNDKDQAERTRKMVGQIEDIDYTVVDSNLEALILETNLIKETRPKYNILMKDDKNYVYVKITVAEEYPRIYLVRKVARDKARYFGPKTAAYKVINTLKLLKRIFPYRNCELAMDYGVHGESRHQNMSPAGLEYHRKHCIGPCMTSVSPQEYCNTVNQVIGFFEGKRDDIIGRVKEDMHKAASEKKFEVAASIRDKLKALEEINETQRISDPNLRNIDIVNYSIQDDRAYFVLFQVREGKLINQENFIFSARDANKGGTEDSEALSAFLEQYYEKASDIPSEILIPHSIEESDTAMAWLSEMKGQKVKLIVPERGKKNHLLELSAQNAQSFARQSQIKWQGHEKDNRDQALEELRNLLKLKKAPVRLECYDISHFQGSETVGSMVVFDKGFPKKDDYRHFKLHCGQDGVPNDYASMEEVLSRRLKYLKPAAASAQTKLRKPLKKELPLIKKSLRVKKLPAKTFLVIEKDKKYAGFLQIMIFPQKKALVEKFDFTLPPDLSFIVKKAAEKIKVRRLHIASPSSYVNLFEEAGCELVKKIPDHIKPRAGEQIMVFDKIRHIEDKSFGKKPDIIIIDGGKGQLSSAVKIIGKYGLSEKLPVIAIAKKEEEIFIPGNKTGIILAKDNQVLHLIQHIRNESHRFAVTYNQKLRLKATTTSILDSIFGLGPELKTKLLRRFGSTEAIKNASEAEIAETVGQKIAKKLKETL